MNNHPYPDSFAVEEAFRRTLREVERKQLIRTVKGQNTGVWNSLVARAKWAIGSFGMGSGGSRSWRAKSIKLQEDCC
jgi:hypothetical protein